jgi:hypothetical protein
MKKVTVVHEGKTEVQMDVNKDTTVGDLRYWSGFSADKHYEHIELLHDGRKMEHDRTLESYNLGKNDKVEVYHKLWRGHNAK